MKDQKKELVEWLDNLAPWETFFTSSPKYDVTSKGMVGMFEKFMKRKDYKHVSYVYSVEPYKGRGWHTMEDFTPAVHLHAMFDAGHNIKWTKFWGEWFKKYGRASTEPIAHKADVESYVSKYIMKEQELGATAKNEGREIWWNVKLSRYRERMARIGRRGLLRPIVPRDDFKLTPAV